MKESRFELTIPFLLFTFTDHPLKCHWPEMLERALVPGERVTGKDCVRLTCLPNFSVLGTT